jgi:heptosyltransferase-3
MMTRKQRYWALKKATLKHLVPFAYGTIFHRTRTKAAENSGAPRRILLLNGAHIGDVIIATSLIPIVRSAYPSAEIGFVAGSWAQMVVRNHPEVAYTHCIDHWKANRSSDGLYRKMRQFRSTWRVALKEIRELKYDVAICMYTNFPDFLDLCWAARIPVRIGFRQSLLSSLATDLVDEIRNPFATQAARMAETLRALPIDSAHFQLRQSTLPASTASSILEVCSLLQVSRIEDSRYRIIHMGSGAPLREMPVDFWREMAEKLSPHCTLLFTGRGRREQENIATVTRGLANCINACDRLTWDGFVAAVRHAEVLYGVESMAGHVAGAVGTKCVVVYGGTSGVAQWRPEGKGSIVMTNHVPCAPCGLPQGCAAMTCMRNISPDDLVRLGG